MNDDLISRSTIKHAIYDVCLRENNTDIFKKILDRINELPSVILQESKTGHWITHGERITLLTGETATGGVICSECGYKTHNHAHIIVGCPYKYCPNCGAKMIEPQESEEV